MRINHILLHAVAGIPAAFLNRSEGSLRAVAEVAAPRAGAVRLAGLDFAKGALVLVMVLYHWMNYFIGFDGDYRYLRFLTPSFIFLAGFLISQVYFPRFQAGDRRMTSRLVRRGLKLLGIVLFLNVAAKVLGIGMVGVRTAHQSLGALVWAFLTGSMPVAFSVLVPIGYLLILSAELLMVSKRCPRIFHAVAAVLIAVALFCDWNGYPDGYLEVFSIGMLGASIGFVRVRILNDLIRHRLALVMVYVVYVAALARWNAVYALQVVAVCLNLLVLYAIGEGSSAGGVLRRWMVELGEYSLFGYIAQIVILQVLRRLAHVAGEGPEVVWGALAACAVTTMVVVRILDRVRRRVPAVNRLYSAVFA